MWTLGPKLAFMDSWACGPKLRVKSGNKPSQFQNLRLFFETFPPHIIPLCYISNLNPQKKVINFQSLTTMEGKIPRSQKREKKSQKDQICLFDSKAEEELILLLAKRSILSLSLSPPNFVSFLVIFLLFQLPFFFFF